MYLYIPYITMRTKDQGPYQNDTDPEQCYKHPDLLKTDPPE